MSRTVAEYNLFMMCQTCNSSALTQLPDGYTIRKCKKEELDIWKAFPYDSEGDRIKYAPFMTDYFDRTYRPDEARFWDSCLFLCDHRDTPVGTCFAWKAYGGVTTIHWFKIKKEYEGRGLGRALLSFVMAQLGAVDYPVYLHTQPGSFRAIKLYGDFGFVLLTDDTIGYRQNELKESLPYLKENMPQAYYNAIAFGTAPKSFLAAVKTSPLDEF